MDLLRENFPASFDTDEITELPGEAVLLFAEEPAHRSDFRRLCLVYEPMFSAVRN